MLARLKTKREDGAIALLTLIFMMTAGVASIILLWSIGMIMASYNKLYIANQAAAYSAATTATNSSEGLSSQLVFDCDGAGSSTGDTTICERGDNTFDVANDVFDKNLTGDSNYGGFGLIYDSNNPSSPSNTVKLYTVLNHSGTLSNNPGLEIFEINATPSQAKTYCDRINSSNNSTYKTADNGQVVCWRIIENGVTFPWQYTSGVITRAEANVPRLPGVCSSNGCPMVKIRVQAAASLNQTTAPNDFNTYLK